MNEEISKDLKALIHRTRVSYWSTNNKINGKTYDSGIEQVKDIANNGRVAILLEGLIACLNEYEKD